MACSQSSLKDFLSGGGMQWCIPIRQRIQRQEPYRHSCIRGPQHYHPRLP